ncbi:hypothetical protein HZS_6072 [Henneguya salminicola]|nr:hypothetical protein HZS_6072 [Henneguya salminicola]
MKIVTLFFLSSLFLRFAQTDDFEFFPSEKIDNMTATNQTEHEPIINILHFKTHQPRQDIDIDKAYVAWHKPNPFQIALLRQTLDANTRYRPLKNFEVRKIGFQIEDDNFYAIFRRYQKIYVKILLWRSTNTYNNMPPPEIIDVTEKDPFAENTR